MVSATLTVIQTNAEFDIDRLTPLVAEGRASWDDLLELCRSYRKRGAVSLLLDCAPQAWQANLHRSGVIFAQHMPAIPETNRITSDSAPFLDALAAGAFASARDIALHSRRNWNPGLEYEEDFLYFHYLMTALGWGSADSHLDVVLDRLRELAEDSPRTLACAALALRSSVDFDSAAELLLAEHRDLYEKGIRGEYILEEDWATDGPICIEAIALLRLAKVRGLDVQKHYALVPSLLVDLSPVERYDSWPEWS